MTASFVSCPVTRDNIESLLDAGQLYANLSYGKFYKVRRNGKTQRWKRDPLRFRLPIKCGFRTCFAITERDFVGGALVEYLWRAEVDTEIVGLSRVGKAPFVQEARP